MKMELNPEWGNLRCPQCGNVLTTFNHATWSLDPNLIDIDGFCDNCNAPYMYRVDTHQHIAIPKPIPTDANAKIDLPPFDEDNKHESSD